MLIEQLAMHSMIYDDPPTPRLWRTSTEIRLYGDTEIIDNEQREEDRRQKTEKKSHQSQVTSHKIQFEINNSQYAVRDTQIANSD